MLKKIAGSLILLFFTILPVNAAVGENIYINEVAWMGSETSSNDEWIELYNPNDQNISLASWNLSWDGGNIDLSGEIPAKSYFLLERTNDDSVPEITADQIYTGSLGNSGEDLILKNQDNEIIDSASFSAGWPAGDNEQKLTMERKCGLEPGDQVESWQNSSVVGGTPKDKNICSATPPACEPQEINRQCSDDGLAEITYSYQDATCGDDFFEQKTDPDCACQYTEWTNQECTSNNKRLQVREELSGFSYCNENLSQEIEDESCQDSSLNIKGRACWLENYHWQCDRNAKIEITDEKIILTVPQKQTEENFTLQNQKDFFIFTIYQAQNKNSQFALILNNKTNKAFAFGNGFRFKGKITE